MTSSPNESHKGETTQTAVISFIAHQQGACHTLNIKKTGLQGFWLGYRLKFKDYWAKG